VRTPCAVKLTTVVDYTSYHGAARCRSKHSIVDRSTSLRHMGFTAAMETRNRQLRKRSCNRQRHPHALRRRDTSINILLHRPSTNTHRTNKIPIIIVYRLPASKNNLQSHKRYLWSAKTLPESRRREGIQLTNPPLVSSIPNRSPPGWLRVSRPEEGNWPLKDVTVFAFFMLMSMEPR